MDEFKKTQAEIESLRIQVHNLNPKSGGENH